MKNFKWVSLLKSSWLSLNCFRVNLKAFLLIYGALMSFFFFFRNYFGTTTFYDEWYTNKSHYARDYISLDKPTTLSYVENPCMQPQSPLILIIVCSNLKNGYLRQNIRETWAADSKKHNVHVLFLIGQSMNLDLNDDVMEESLKHNDVIIENFVDSYHNLTIKSIMMLKWVKHNCPNAQFVMKMDDDVYLNLRNLVIYVKSGEVELNNFSVGKLYTKEKPHRERFSKWYIPDSVYPRKVYPPFLCGVGYLVSTDVALRLYEESFKHQLIFIEDVFITGLCAEQIGLKHKNHLGFWFFEHAVEVECNSIHPHMIFLSHHVNTREMQRIHHDILNCDTST